MPVIVNSFTPSPEASSVTVRVFPISASEKTLASAAHSFSFSGSLPASMHGVEISCVRLIMIKGSSPKEVITMASCR